MFDKEMAKKIVVKVNTEKVCLASEENNFITGCSKLKYYYSDLTERETHIKKMQEDGYTFMDDIGAKEKLYASLMDDTSQWIYICYAEYVKYN